MTFLITTSIEKEYLENSDFIYAGRWCLSNSLDVNLNQDKTLLYFHWDRPNSLSENQIYLSEIKEKVLSNLSFFLNDYHNTSHSNTYWNIIIGYWINIYCTVLFDRWKVLQTAVDEIKNVELLVLNINNSEYCINDSEEFTRLACESSEWNYFLFLKIADNFNLIKKVHIDKSLNLNFKKNSQSTSPFGTFVKKLLIKIHSNLNFLIKYNKYFFFKTYIPFFYNFKLKLFLGEFPSLYSNFFFYFEKNIFTSKQRNFVDIKHNFSDDPFLEIALSYVKDYLPSIYLEGYKSAIKDFEDLNLPLSPKIIYTANAHFNNDKFKIWMAEKKKNGAIILIGEHGGLRIAKFNESHNYEIKLSDYYLITGDRYLDDNKFIPVGNFRMIHKKILPNPRGSILIITTSVPKYVYDLRSFVFGPQFFDYFQNLLKLIKGINSSNILVRTPKSDYGWLQEKHLKKRFPNLCIDNGNKKLFNLLKKSSIVVCTYNGTVFIDTISINFPTVITWDFKYWEISEDAKLIFLELESVGIFHKCPIQTAKFLNNISGDVNKWWYSSKVQDAVKRFCISYGGNPDSSMTNIRKSILSLCY